MKGEYPVELANERIGSASFVPTRPRATSDNVLLLLRPCVRAAVIVPGNVAVAVSSDLVVAWTECG
jgi:hypothetical protein